MTSELNIACGTNGLQLRHVDGNRGLSDALRVGTERPLESSVLSQSKLYDAFHPYLWSFSELEWSVFGTLTWSNPRRRGISLDAEILRRSDFHGLLQVACLDLGIRRKHIPFYHAMEWTAGEQAHFHFLIAKDNRLKVSSSVLARFLEDCWKDRFKPIGSERRGAGTADVRPYDQAQGLAGVSYCLKRDYDSKGRECERFDEVSPALMTLLRKEMEPMQVS